MTISISASGISLDGPLVAGEKVAVTVSGLALAAEDKPTLALLARFPDAILASVELAEDADAPGTWTGELDTATKQTALFFATARADERRDAALELVAGRVSLARLTVPMANSALCPKPDGSPFASPVYVPVPGPPGTGGDPYDQPPEMDGEASAGATDEYARGDHRHPTDTSRMAASATGVDIKAGGDVGNISITAALVGLDEDLGGKQDTIADLATIRSGAAAGATAVQRADLATVATTGNYEDLTNKPTIPAAQVNADWNAASGVAQILNKPTIPDVSGKADSISLAPAFSTSSTYAVGDYVTHEGLLYKCTTAVATAGAWNAANWTAVAVADEMGADTPLPFDAECEYVTFPAGAYVDPEIVDIGLPNAYDIDARIRIPTYGSFRFGNWREGDQTKSFMIFNYSGGGYKLCKYWSDSGSGIAQTSDFFQIKTQSNSYTLNGTTRTCTPTTTVRENASFIICGLDNKVDGQKGGSEVDIDIAYFRFIGNTVLRDMVPVRVGTVGYLYDKVSGRLFGSAVGSIPLVPGPDKATPTITTPGRIVELTPALRYSFASPTPSVSGTSATVACEDRAINDFTVATGITSLTITPPAAVTGRARDFFCRVTLTDSSLPTVTLSGATIDIGAAEVAGMTQGVNLLMFTEIASGHWLASRRSAS